MTAAPIETAGDIAAAATALSGLLLVYMGMVTTSYESFGPDAKSAVRAKFKFRMGIALAGIYCALAAAVGSLSGKWFKCEGLVWFSFLAILVSLILILIFVTIAYKDID
jgi:hypothetical protein